jgi:hypothetical protein
MWGIRQSIRTMVAFSRRRHGTGRPVGLPHASATDWLPPVLDPGDWSVAMLADRSAGWYFDRN